MLSPLLPYKAVDLARLATSHPDPDPRQLGKRLSYALLPDRPLQALMARYAVAVAADIRARMFPKGRLPQRDTNPVHKPRHGNRRMRIRSSFSHCASNGAVFAMISRRHSDRKGVRMNNITPCEFPMGALVITAAVASFDTGTTHLEPATTHRFRASWRDRHGTNAVWYPCNDSRKSRQDIEIVRHSGCVRSRKRILASLKPTGGSIFPEA